tara:strand:- start:886 stop:1785 length:900 start_codon:yes stop_codon:yes gene_type:complete
MGTEESKVGKRLSPDNFEQIKPIGCGSFGRVYKVRYNDAGLGAVDSEERKKLSDSTQEFIESASKGKFSPIPRQWEAYGSENEEEDDSDEDKEKGEGKKGDGKEGDGKKVEEGQYKKAIEKETELGAEKENLKKAEGAEPIDPDNGGYDEDEKKKKLEKKKKKKKKGKRKIGLLTKGKQGKDSGDLIFAMKVLDKAAVIENDLTEHVLLERDIMGALRDDPFIVHLHYSFQTETKLYFILDYLGGGSLFYHLSQVLTGMPRLSISIYRSNYPSIHLSIIYLSMYLSNYPSLSLSICLST